jgi:hypothetical protein
MHSLRLEKKETRTEYTPGATKASTRSHKNGTEVKKEKGTKKAATKGGGQLEKEDRERTRAQELLRRVGTT